MSSANLLPMGHFNNPAQWNATETGNGLSTVEDGALHLLRPASGDSASGGPIPSLAAVPGVTYDLFGAAERINGTITFSFGGQTPFIQASGEFHLVLTATTTGSLSIVATTPPSEWRLNYLIITRRDQSMSKVVLTLRDYDGDKKQTSTELGPVTDGPSYVTREAQAAAIRDAVNAVAGNIAQYDFLAQSTEPNNVNTATPVYQTHVRWIVELFDSVTGDGPYAFDIPTADLGNAALFLDSSVEHDPAAAEWIALKAAMNGIVINPRTGSTMTVGRIYLEE